MVNSILARAANRPNHWVDLPRQSQNHAKPRRPFTPPAPRPSPSRQRRDGGATSASDSRAARRPPASDRGGGNAQRDAQRTAPKDPRLAAFNRLQAEKKLKELVGQKK